MLRKIVQLINFILIFILLFYIEFNNKHLIECYKTIIYIEEYSIKIYSVLSLEPIPNKIINNKLSIISNYM